MAVWRLFVMPISHQPCACQPSNVASMHAGACSARRAGSCSSPARQCKAVLVSCRHCHYMLGPSDSFLIFTCRSVCRQCDTHTCSKPSVLAARRLCTLRTLLGLASLQVALLPLLLVVTRAPRLLRFHRARMLLRACGLPVAPRAQNQGQHRIRRRAQAGPSRQATYPCCSSTVQESLGFAFFP